MQQSNNILSLTKSVFDKYEALAKTFVKKTVTTITDKAQYVVGVTVDGAKHIAAVTTEQVKAAIVIADTNIEMGIDLAGRMYQRSVDTSVGIYVRTVDNFKVLSGWATNTLGKAKFSFGKWIEARTNSPTSFSKLYEIPEDASHLSFSYEILQADKGDSLEVFINDEQVYYHLVADDVGKGVLLAEFINVSKFAGSEVRVTFRINSFDEEPLVIRLHDVEFVAIAEVAELATHDQDNDGLLDVWELVFLGDLSSDGTQDSDGDGLTDLQEFQHGTDPKDKDTNKDGIPDSLQDVQDNIPPVTTASTTGSVWSHGLFISKVGVSFYVEDNSGSLALKQTEYSLDGGQTWNLFAASSPVVITAEGTTTVLYRSSDVFGNIETSKSLVVRVVSVKWFLEDALAKLKSINTGNKDIDRATDAVEKDLGKVIVDKSWLDRDRLSWPKGLSLLTKEVDVVKDIGDILNKAGRKKNNIPVATQAVYRDTQSEIVQSSALLAKLSFDKAKAIRAKNAAGQRALDRAIARIQKMLDRAAAKEEKKPKQAVRLYGAAWFATETLLKTAGATPFRASNFGGLYSAEDMKDLVD